MRVGILTHPQGINYGGILQCYALSAYLKKMGHTPIVIRRETDRDFFLWRMVRAVLRFLHFPRYYKKDSCNRGRFIAPFVETYLDRTKPVRSQYEMKRVCSKYNLDAVIVGSDQVWRRDFALKYGYNYFLDFVPSDVIKLSYAASFGYNEWGYGSSETRRIKELVQNFRGVSVREEDAIQLCKDNLGITPQWLIDPTLLLTKEDYETVTSPRLIAEPYVFVYWLGDQSIVSADVEKYRQKGYKVYEIYLREEREQDSIEDWLSYIKYADFIITDSFHGLVFSTIFNKPFIVRKNQSGGLSRLTALFKMIGISDPGKEVVTPDYENLDLAAYRERSHQYLSEILK